jgi:hypothetical protein
MDQGGGKRRSDTPTVSQEALASHPFAALLRRIAGLIHLRVFPRLFNFINSVNRCGRSCGMLRRHFELTERHVLEGEEHIAGQREIVACLEHLPEPLTLRKARDLLRKMEHAQMLRVTVI